MKSKKKLEIHNESYKKLYQLTKGKRPGQEDADEYNANGGKEESGSSFRNKMFELLDKTNHRV